MDARSAFPNKWLKSHDLQGRTATVTIESWSLEKIGDDTKPVLRFVGKDKGLVLNKTKVEALGQMFGTYEMDSWRGRRFMLVPGKTPYQGKMVECIFVEPAPQSAAPVARHAPPPPPPPPADDFHASDDDIPF